MANPMPPGSQRISAPVHQEQRGLTKVTFLAFTETTGLFPVMPRLVEVAGMRVRLGGITVLAVTSACGPRERCTEDLTALQGQRMKGSDAWSVFTTSPPWDAVPAVVPVFTVKRRSDDASAHGSHVRRARRTPASSGGLSS
jgi:hypothetical protein